MPYLDEPKYPTHRHCSSYFRCCATVTMPTQMTICIQATGALLIAQLDILKALLESGKCTASDRRAVAIQYKGH